MSSLHLEQFEIHGFRAFKELRLEKLGRVNLLTGRNSVGKTAVLEAIELFGAQGAVSVQVFATTHSWDCVEAFARAAIEDEHEEGCLVRLQQVPGGIAPTLFDERRLAIATREQIEVR